MAQRLEYIDRMKGFAILLVTMGHLFLPHTLEGVNYPVAQMIYSFHMAFFFFLSGYMLAMTHRIEKNGMKKFVFRKVQSLLVPWLTFCLVVPVMINHDYGFPQLSVLIFYPVGSYWFLPLLLIFMLMWLVVYKIEYRLNDLSCRKIIGGGKSLWCNVAGSVIFAMALAVSGVVAHMYHLIVYAIYFTAFSFGYYVSRESRIKRFILKNSVFGILSIILIISWKLGPIDTHGGVAWRSMMNLIHNLVCGICGCVVFFNLLYKMSLPALVDKYLQETGKMSLAIYLLPIVIIPSGYVFSQDLPFAAINISVLTIAVVVNLICYCIGKIIFEIPYLRFILFGKK